MNSPRWITNLTASPFYARRLFTVEKTVQSAVIQVTGLGQFNLYLNGQKVSEDILEPGWTDYRKTIQYVTYDVTDLLSSGENVLGIEVGNGWYILDAKEGHGYSFHFPPFMPPNPNPYKPFGEYLVARASLTVTYTDGTTLQIGTDKEWEMHPHAVLWSNVYGSEYIDGARIPGGQGGEEALWAMPGRSLEGWEPAAELSEDMAPKGKLCPRVQPPIRVLKEYPGTYLGEVEGIKVYDMGQNIAGILSAQVKGKAGEEVCFYPAEKLDAKGLPDQMAKNWMLIDNVVTYKIAQTDEWESVSQVFTYFSGRYIGVKGEAEVRSLMGSAISSAWKEAGSFTCSDERLNQIYAMIERTVEANMVSVHTDCPTIERFAWQEPNHLMAPSIFYMKDGKDLWRKFLNDCRDAQHTKEDRFMDFEGNAFCPGDGLVPSHAPCYVPNVLPVPGMGSFYDIIGWGSTIILGTRWHYLFYGDISIVEENYEAGLRYFKHLLTKLDANGFISHGLGDWGNPENILARENVETALLYADAITLADFAATLGREEEGWLREEAKKICDHYNEELLVKNEEGRWCYRCYEKRQEGLVMTQACEAMPLYWGMVPEDKKADVAECFKRTLLEKGGFSAGEVGLPYIIQTAARNGLHELIYSFITKEEHPSYYAFILAGETTLGEYWEENPRSHCHDMMGHIIEWYYSGLGGIEPLAPGFAKVRVNPWMPEGMKDMHFSYETPKGKITVDGAVIDGET